MSIAAYPISETAVSAQIQKAVKTPRKRQLSPVPDEQMVPEPR